MHRRSLASSQPIETIEQSHKTPSQMLNKQETRTLFGRWLVFKDIVLYRAETRLNYSQITQITQIKCLDQGKINSEILQPKDINIIGQISFKSTHKQIYLLLLF